MDRLKNYYRRITTLLPRDWFNREVSKSLLLLFSTLLLGSLLLMLGGVYMMQSLLSQAYQSQQSIHDRYYFWVEKMEEYPTSPDVFYNAAIAARSAGREQSALEFLQEAILLDPQFSEAVDLQSEIIGKK